jgi:hypothetical protein
MGDIPAIALIVARVRANSRNKKERKSDLG